MRKVSDKEYDQVSDAERALIDLIDYFIENHGATSYEEAILKLQTVSQRAPKLVKDDTFREYLEDEYTPNDMMLSRASDG